MEVYKITFDPDMLESGINMIAITEDPAIEVLSLRFDKQHKVQFDSDKQLIVGPAIIPNKKIYRREGDKEFYVVFTEEVIDAMLEKFKSEHREVQLNLEHDEARTVKGFVKEAWIIEDSEKDKSAIYGFNLPVGTLMFSVKISDKDVWESVIKAMPSVGFSIEGLMGLSFNTVQNNINNNVNMKKKTKKRLFAGKVVNKKRFNLKTKTFEEVQVLTEGEVLVVGDLAIGSEVQTMNEQGEMVTAADGEYILVDSNVQITVAAGVITDIAEVEGMDEAVEEKAEEVTEEKPAEAATTEDKDKFAEVMAKLAEFEERIEAVEAFIAQEEKDMEENAFSADRNTKARLKILKNLIK